MCVGGRSSLDKASPQGPGGWSQQLLREFTFRFDIILFVAPPCLSFFDCELEIRAIEIYTESTLGTVTSLHHEAVCEPIVEAVP